MRRTSAAAALLTAVLAIPAASASAAPVPAPSATPAARELGTVVTLITGDRVTTTGKGARLQVVSVDPAPGREGITFHRVHLNGHELVVPSDATPLLVDERLDRRLLDVTALVAMGYHDTVRTDVPVLLEGNAAHVDARGLHGRSRLGRVNMTAAAVTKDGATGAWEDMLAAAEDGEVTKIWLDGQVRATLDESVSRTGAPRLWRSGLTGKGVKVAVLDTGYDVEHPDLQGLVDGSADFANEGTVDDGNGHGTHVSSIVAGSGAASGGRYRGMAPGVRLLEGKVLNRFGSGSESGVLQGMTWAVEQGADVISMSLGASVPDAGNDPLSQALNRLSADSDSLFVVAAGNEGAAMTIGSPGAAEAALTVGSVTKDGELSAFSSQGPREGDLAVKPEITAPGSDIVAARAAGTFPMQAVDDRYARLSGTSMATPHVAGAAALLAQRHPDWDGERIKAALVGAADANAAEATAFGQGAGELDVAEAATAPVVATTDRPLTARLPVAEGRGPIEWTLGYANLGNHEEKLHLSIELTDVGTGRVAPDGLVSAASDDLRLAPGAEAAARLTVDAGVTTPGRFAGWVVASGAGGVEVRTPIAVIVEPRSHEVTFHRPAKPDGVERDTLHTMVQNETTGDLWYFPVGDQPRSLALPEGAYRVFGHLFTQDVGPDGRLLTSRSTHFATRVEVSGDRDVRVDVSDARPVRIGLTGSAARPTFGSTSGIVSRVAVGGFGLLAPISGGLHEVYAQPSGPIDDLDLLYSGTWLEPLVTATAVGGEPLELQVANAGATPWVGTLTARVVNVGAATAEDISAADLTGAIAYARFPSTVPFAERSARLQALAGAGAGAVLLGEQSAFSPALPSFTVASQQLPRLEERLGQGGLTLAMTGIAKAGEGAFLVDKHEDGVPARADFRVDAEDLAHVDTTVPAMGAPTYHNTLITVAELDGLLVGADLILTVPSSVRIHYTPEVPWTAYIQHFLIGETTPLGGMETDPTAYSRGETRSESFIEAPFNPALSIQAAGEQVPYVYRTGDELRFGPPMFSDAAGHRTRNVAGVDTGTVVLATDGGSTVAHSDAPRLTVEGLTGSERWYRLTAQAQRNHPRWPLSTSVTSKWRFRSGHVARGVTALPLIDLRYDVPLSDDQSVSAGRSFPITLRAGHQVGSSGKGATVRRVEYSLDGGATWSDAALSTDRDVTRATIPALAAGVVSLRTTAVDGAGGRLTETLTSAFYVR